MKFQRSSKFRTSTSHEKSSWIDSFITTLIPTFLITRKAWSLAWRAQDEKHTLANIKNYSWSLFALFSISSIPIFFNPTLQPKAFWIIAKLGTAFAFLLTATSSTRFHQKIKMNGVLLIYLLGAIYLCTFQAMSINYRPQTPYFYVPIFAAFSTLILRLNVITSSLVFISLLTLANHSIQSQAVESLHQWSAASVAYILMIYLRIRTRDEIKIFILQQEGIDQNKQLIEAQKNLTDQIAAFLPRELYRRVNHDIARGESPITAVENQLRPKKVTGSVLFTDIRGFTQLTKSGDEALLKIVIPAQKKCTDIVEQNLGIPRLQGDLVYSYYDLSDPKMNMILALKTALEIDESTKTIQASQTIGNLERYIIISFGNLLVGNLGGTNGSRDITVLGDAANIPSRIDSVTKHPLFKERLSQRKVILTEQAWLQLPDAIRDKANPERFEFNEHTLRLRDFEKEERVILIENSKSLYESILACLSNESEEIEAAS
jgi:class 3 adenylate cyclase